MNSPRKTNFKKLDPAAEASCVTDTGQIELSPGDSCGSCWVSNGDIALFVSFEKGSVTVSAYPPGDDMNGLPVIDECLGVVTWGLKG